MKKILFIVLAISMIPFATANAEVLTDAQLAGVYAGDDAFIDDQVSSVASTVAAQKNIGAIGSIEAGSVINSVIDNVNEATVANVGDSAIAIQTNIGAMAGMGVSDNDGNAITNVNDAVVDNLVVQTDGSIDAQSSGSTTSGAGTTSALTSVSGLQSAVASQTNVGAIVGVGNVSNSVMTNSNTASVTNTPGI
ncbi:MAG: hypothetical protein WC404_04130 [Candidatus Omnitrophota bacterium]|jgi:hypothetical protein